MSTFRVPPRKHFTLLSNPAVRDPRTSYKAKGLLGTMLSFDPDWVFRKKHLLTLMKDGKAALDTGIKELTEAGYVVANGQTRPDRGRFGSSDYDVYDYPHGNPLPPETPDPEATSSDAPEGAGGLRLLADHRYVKVRNAALRDPDLSCKAVGILQTMLSFPPNWNFSEEYLESFATDRIDSIRAGLKELMATRYIVRLEQQRNAKGYFGAQAYIVADYRLGTEEDPQRDQTLHLMSAPGESGQGDSVVGKSGHGEPVLGKSGHGGSVLGLSVHGESAPGKSVNGKSAPKKNDLKKTVEKKTISKKSSRQPERSAPPRPEEPTTTQEGKRKGLNKRITTTFKNLYANFTQEDPRRAKAWHQLDPEKQDAAFGAAQERKKNPYEPKAFSTVLKEELDLAAGLTRSDASTNAPEARKAVEQRRMIAKQSEETAFEAALDAGHDPETAAKLAFDAYKKKLDDLTANGVNNSPDELVPAQPGPSEAEVPPLDAVTGLTGVAFQILSGKLMEIYRRDGRRLQAWSTLTPEQRDQALRRARDGKEHRPANDEFVWALVAELDAATGLKKATTSQSAETQKSDTLR